MVLSTISSMYLFHFSNYYGNDRIVLYPQNMSNVTMGDLLLIQGQYFLVLGKEVVRGCEYQLEGLLDFHIAEKKLISRKAMKYIHEMVREYFSSYKNVVPLRLGNDIEQLLKRKTESNKRKRGKGILLWDEHNECIVEKERVDYTQSLLVFPTTWSLYHYGKKWLEEKWIAVDSGNRTEKQRNSVYRKIKNGQVSTLLCTSAGIFQDWKRLTYSYLHQPHQWRYKNRRDPRYEVATILSWYKEKD